MSVWYELLIAGTGDKVDTLVEGLAPDQVCRGEDLDLHAGPFPERLLERLGAKTHHLLFAPVDQARELIRRIEADSDLRLERTREVLSASFAFETEAFSHPVAEKIEKALHTDLPAGVKLEDWQESEERDPLARGLEIKGTVHEYTYQASGRFTGSLPGILEIHRRLRDVDFVKEKQLEIEGREVPSPGA
jgi:hypothetical protein